MVQFPVAGVEDLGGMHRALRRALTLDGATHGQKAAVGQDDQVGAPARVGHLRDDLPGRRRLAHVQRLDLRAADAAAADAHDLARLVGGRRTLAQGEVRGVDRVPGLGRDGQRARRARRGRAEHARVRKQEHLWVELEAQRRVGQFAPESGRRVPDLGNRRDQQRVLLDPSRRRQHPTVRQGGQRRVPAPVGGEVAERPTLGERVEDVGVRQARRVVRSNRPAEDEYATVGERGVPRTEDVVLRCELRRELIRLGIPDVGGRGGVVGTVAAPPQHPAGVHQREVGRLLGPAGHRAPLADLIRRVGQSRDTERALVTWELRRPIVVGPNRDEAHGQDRKRAQNRAREFH